METRTPDAWVQRGHSTCLSSLEPPPSSHLPVLPWLSVWSHPDASLKEKPTGPQVFIVWRTVLAAWRDRGSPSYSGGCCGPQGNRNGMVLALKFVRFLRYLSRFPWAELPRSVYTASPKWPV